jgi:hypothetical protein
MDRALSEHRQQDRRQRYFQLPHQERRQVWHRASQ